MGIDLTKPTPLYQQIVADIQKKVDTGILKVGEQLGSQHKLAQHYHVSLITVKKALSELINRGVLFSRIGKGTYVAAPATRLPKQGVIGLVLRDLKNPFFSLILHSVEAAASQSGYSILLANATDRLEKEETLIHHFLELGMNGIIITSSAQTYRATPGIRKLQEKNIPNILVSYIQDEDVNHVGTDHEQGGFLATTHLLQAGYREIGYIGGESENLLAEIRYQGYLRALKSFNLEINRNYLFELQSKWNDFEEGYRVGERFLNMKKRPEAMFAFKDMVALGFEQAMLDNNIRIPGDVALVGFDDIERAQYAPVPLTTIHQPTDVIGKLAVESILDQIEGKVIRTRTILEPTLVVRDSCGVKAEKVRE